MFECFSSPIEVAVSPIASSREDWHASTSIELQDRVLRHLDPTALSADEALSALVQLQDHRARLDAIEVSLLVRAAGATRVVRDVLVEPSGDGSQLGGTEGGCRVLHLVDEVVDEMACALRRPHGVLQRQVHQARLLRGPLARTHDELAAGRITLQHASAIAEQAERITGDALIVEAVCDRLQDRVLPHAIKETPSQTRSRARRAVVTVDPAGERERRRQARRGCNVNAYGINDGLAVVEARLPISEAAWVMALVDADARACVTDGRMRDTTWLARHGLDSGATLGQLRAAAFVDCMRTGLIGSGASDHAEGTQVGSTRLTVEMQVLIDAAALAGLAADPVAWAQIGSGAPQAFDRADLVRLLADPGTHATFRRLVSDPFTGALIDRGATSYPVSASLAAWIIDRDITCRFPGCTRAADHCDVDHVVDFADGGRTTTANTGALCRRHHNRKTHGDWTVSQPRADGSCTFTSPTGREYEHSPVELIPRPAPTAPRQASPPLSGPASTWRPGDPMPF
jgi:hypothetical protein